MDAAEYLRSIRACHDSILWAKGKTLTEAWETCDDAAWMMWFLGRTGLVAAEELAQFLEHYAAGASNCMISSLHDIVRYGDPITIANWCNDITYRYSELEADDIRKEWPGVLTALSHIQGA